MINMSFSVKIRVAVRFLPAFTRAAGNYAVKFTSVCDPVICAALPLESDLPGLLVDRHDIGKRPADIDPDPPRHREPLTSRRRIMLALAEEIDQQRPGAWI
jgi:hypothetical protein